jgi:hypothetical protein
MFTVGSPWGGRSEQSDPPPGGKQGEAVLKRGSRSKGPKDRRDEKDLGMEGTKVIKWMERIEGTKG